jgi:hypothetical protein
MSAPKIFLTAHEDHIMRNPRVTAQPLCMLLMILACGSAALAQSNKGAIVGTVKDPNGALVKDAKITVIRTATGETREATSDESGNYAVPNLDPGKYRVSADSSGFQSVVLEDVAVETNARLPIDINFSAVSGTAGTVTITSASAPLVESETSVRGDIITGRQVVDLPLPQRNFTLLAALSPGVTRPNAGLLGGGGNFVSGGPDNSLSTESNRFRESGGSVLAANGARPTNNNFTLDGIDNNEPQFGQIAIFPQPDAIAEFKIETSVPSAESGRAGGAIISTTFKSGTNAVHGTVYEFYLGNFAGARPANLPANQGLANTVTHNFGGAVGGPIFLPRPGEGGSAVYDGRNRSFFFFNYNGQRNFKPIGTGNVTVPTLKMRVGDFSELLVPGQTRVYRTINGNVTATVGTIFDRNANPIPGNDLRNCPTCTLSPVAVRFFNSYPLPTSSGRENNYAINRIENYVQDAYDIRIDHNITTSNTLFGRYSKSQNQRLRSGNFPLGSSPTGLDFASGGAAGTEFGNTKQVALGDTHIFSPTIINDARAGYSRVGIGIFLAGIGGALGFKPDVTTQLGVPNINACGLPCEGTILVGVLPSDVDKQLEFVGDGGPFFFQSNNFYFGDTLTVVRGNHAFKFGGDLRVRQATGFDGGRAGFTKGNVRYDTGIGGGFISGRDGLPVGPLDAGSSYANILLGYPPTDLERGFPGGPFLKSSKEIAFYVQDDWKVRPDLTLNVGLRYDIFTAPTERFDRQSNFNPATGNITRASDANRALVNTDKNNFGPRIGFAYSGLKEDKTFVIRGGYGLLYALDVNGRPDLSANPPFASRYFCTITQFGTAACPHVPFIPNLDTGYPLPPPPPSTALVFPAPNQDIFYVDPNVRNEIFHQYNLTFQYEFAPSWLAEAGYVGSLGRNLLVVHNIGRDSDFGPGSRQVNLSRVITTDYTGKSRYDSLQTKVEKRFSEGLSILSAYTWSHAIDDGPGGFAGASGTDNKFGPSNPLRPELDRANSDFDVRHRFTFANVYDLPFGRGRRFGKGMSKMADFFLGGFQLNNIVTIQSGPVYTIRINQGGPRPDLIGDPTPTAAQRARGLEFNPAAFGPPTTPIFANDPNGPKFGTLGRNTFRGQRQEFWDASLFKNFRVSEEFNAQVRIQAYNVLNHVNRNYPERNLNSGDAGIDKAIQRPRQLEFSIKLIF